MITLVITTTSGQAKNLLRLMMNLKCKFKRFNNTSKYEISCEKIYDIYDPLYNIIAQSINFPLTRFCVFPCRVLDNKSTFNFGIRIKSGHIKYINEKKYHLLDYQILRRKVKNLNKAYSRAKEARKTRIRKYRKKIKIKKRYEAQRKIY